MDCLQHVGCVDSCADPSVCQRLSGPGASGMYSSPSEQLTCLCAHNIHTHTCKINYVSEKAHTNMHLTPWSTSKRTCAYIQVRLGITNESAQGQLETHRQNTASQSIIRTRACALNHLRLAGVPHHCGTGSPGKTAPHTQASARPSPGVGGVRKICKDSILSHRGTLLISFYYCRRHKVRD